jgi:hypothetical protein
MNPAPGRIADRRRIRVWVMGMGKRASRFRGGERDQLSLATRPYDSRISSPPRIGPWLTCATTAPGSPDTPAIPMRTRPQAGSALRRATWHRGCACNSAEPGSPRRGSARRRSHRESAEHFVYGCAAPARNRRHARRRRQAFPDNLPLLSRRPTPAPLGA